MGAGSERVSLGDDPYSDYYDSGYGKVDILQCPLGVRQARAGQSPVAQFEPTPERKEELFETKDLKPLGPSLGESIEGLSTDVFDVANLPCDPYF